jgi:hypothetical protein
MRSCINILYFQSKSSTTYGAIVRPLLNGIICYIKESPDLIHWKVERIHILVFLGRYHEIAKKIVIIKYTFYARRNRIVKMIEKHRIVLGALLFASIHARMNDYFHYGMEDREENGGRSFGQRNWKDVTCDDVHTCVSNQMSSVSPRRSYF